MKATFTRLATVIALAVALFVPSIRSANADLPASGDRKPIPCASSIVVTGYASPDDIAANTTISSNNVADMNVQYVGNGPINAAHQVPWLQQVLSKAWPF